MKVRKGFVTNSSSSSFIVLFNNPIFSMNDMLGLIMKNIESDEECYDKFECNRKELAQYLYNHSIGDSEYEAFYVFLSSLSELVYSSCYNDKINQILNANDFDGEMEYYRKGKFDALADTLIETAINTKFKDIPNMRVGHLHIFECDDDSRIGSNIQDTSDMERILKNDGEVLTHDW